MATDFTVDRNSTKWVLGSDGYLKEYTTDQPAIEFNADGSYKGVLVEPESVNEAKASEDLDDATYWGANDTTIATDTETDPKGGTNSFLLSETATNSAHYFNTLLAQRPSIGSGETWTQSVFVKKGDGANAPDIVQMTQSPTFGASQYANFDISVGNGTSGTVTYSEGGTAGIRYYGNGWYRISWTATSTSAGNANTGILFVNNNPTAARAPFYTGQTDANVFIWGAQLEESPIATSYIPTTTGAVTRVKDDIYLTSASSLIGQTEGTLYCEFIFNTESDIFVITDGVNSTTNYVGVLRSSNNLLFRIRYNSSGNINFTTSHSVGQRYKVAVAYKSGDSAVFVNGSQIGTTKTTAFSFSASLSYLEFLNRVYYVSPDDGAHNYRAVALYTTRLSDPECEALTAL